MNENILEDDVYSSGTPIDEEKKEEIEIEENKAELKAVQELKKNI